VPQARWRLLPFPKHHRDVRSAGGHRSLPKIAGRAAREYEPGDAGPDVPALAASGRHHGPALVWPTRFGGPALSPHLDRDRARRFETRPRVHPRGHDRFLRFSAVHPGRQTLMLAHLTSREIAPGRVQSNTMSFGPRRGLYLNAAESLAEEGEPLDAAALDDCDTLDLFYRTLCAAMYNYAPLSGHPGGSISSGRIVQRLLFETMDYDLAHPNRQDADIISYAAGHKALGLYAIWALRNEIARIAAPALMPADEKCQLRLEDLLGFRRNPIGATPLCKKFGAKALDGHPTPATPFVR